MVAFKLPPEPVVEPSRVRCETVELQQFVTDGLGDSSYLLVYGDEAAVVDPQRDVRRFLAAAERRSARIRFAIETHVHNDYVSGALELRAAAGAEIVGPSLGGYAFPFTAMDEGSELALGDARLRAIPTPGHTFEHTAYELLEDGDDPTAVFTGGSLIVGSAGRTDLLGPDAVDELSRAQYRTMRRLAELHDAVRVLPTHGAGSFCATTAPDVDRTSTIGEERRRNPALRAPDEDAFVREQLEGLLAYPTYYVEMAPINRAGPRVFGDVPMLEPLTFERFEELSTRAVVVDARPGAAFASSHVPSSLGIPLDESFASYVGWLLPIRQRIVLILPEGEAERLEIATQLFRIGYDGMDGFLAGGIAAWRAGGGPVESYGTASIDDFATAAREGTAIALDVRQRREWDEGHVEGSRHAFVGELPERLGEIAEDRDIVVACASGFRASIAASLLARAGRHVAVVAAGGVSDALRRAR